MRASFDHLNESPGDQVNLIACVHLGEMSTGLFCWPVARAGRDGEVRKWDETWRSNGRKIAGPKGPTRTN